MTTITRFSIERFRQFEKKATIDLKPITLLIGPNNGGKTAILQALSLFQYCVENCLVRNEKPNGNGALSLKPEYLDADDFARLPLATPADLWPQGRVKGAIKLEATFISGGTLGFEIELKYNRFNIKPVQKDIPDVGSLLKKFAIRSIPVFSGLLPKEEFLVLPSRLERQRSQRYGEIVRNLLWTLKKETPKRFRLLGELLERLYPDAAVDVNYDEELGSRIASARIDSLYHDSVLSADRDLIVAGSGVHQAVQILSGILQPGVSTILLDEPDAHLHARLQGIMMGILTELAESEGIQFLIATHSPQLLRTAPEGSIAICRKGAVVPFAPSPDQLETLESLGAFERMELVPLLQSRRVVFVENRDDRRAIELYVRKKFDKKADDVLRGITFLYTYQEPVSSNVIDKARQVRDLLHDPGIQALGLKQDVAFLSVGDRDYRTVKEIASEERRHRAKAKQPGFGFPCNLTIWRRAELENYLLDVPALERAVDKMAKAQGKQAAWHKVKNDFVAYVAKQIGDQKNAVIERFAARIQDRDRRKNLQTAMDEARSVLDAEWGDGTGWCDAKVVISSLRRFLQDRKLPQQALTSANIIEEMTTLPDDIQNLLNIIRKLSKPSKKRTTSVTASQPAGRASVDETSVKDDV